MKLYEALEPGSSTYFLSELIGLGSGTACARNQSGGKRNPMAAHAAHCPYRRALPMPRTAHAVRCPYRPTLPKPRAAHAVRCPCCVLQLVPVRGSGRVAGRSRFTIEKDSLLSIRAAMPTSNDDWEERFSSLSTHGKPFKLALPLDLT